VYTIQFNSIQFNKILRWPALNTARGLLKVESLNDEFQISHETNDADMISLTPMSHRIWPHDVNDIVIWLSPLETEAYYVLVFVFKFWSCKKIWIHAKCFDARCPSWTRNLRFWDATRSNTMQPCLCQYHANTDGILCNWKRFPLESFPTSCTILPFVFSLCTMFVNYMSFANWSKIWSKI
jgi:hypothetical protein